MRRLLGAIAGALLVAIWAHALIGFGGAGTEDFFGRWMHDAVILVAAATCLVGAIRSASDRLAWAALAAGLLAVAVGDLIYSMAPDLGAVPIPSISDPFWLALYPCTYVALLALIRSRVGRTLWATRLDGIAGGLAIASVLAAVTVSVTVDGSAGAPFWEVATNLAYPVGDVVLLGAIVSAVGLAGWRVDRLWATLCVAVLAIETADLIYMLDSEGVLAAIADAFVATGIVGIAWAAALAPRAAQPRRPTSGGGLFVPVGFGALALTVLALGVPLGLNPVALGLAVAALGLVLVRMALALGELRGAHDDLAVAYEAQKVASAQRERIEIELRLAQKLEAVGQLAAGIAHEINTPIQYVSDTTRFLSDAFADLIPLIDLYAEAMDAAQQGPIAPDLLERIHAAEDVADLDYLRDRVPAAWERAFAGLGQVASIVGAMRTFAHPTTEKAPVDLNELIDNVVIVTANEYRGVADIDVAVADLPPVVCSASDLSQVLINLVVNAAHAISDVVGDSGMRGLIEIRIRTDADSVVISIADTGCGIPGEVADRIFDPFFTTKDVGRGTGQGLAIAHAIVTERHGGSITFTTRPGLGTTFEVRLPTANAVQPLRTESY